MPRYVITYEVTSTRKMTVLADSKEEAKQKYEEGYFIEDAEDSLDNEIIMDIEEENK